MLFKGKPLRTHLNKTLVEIHNPPIEVESESTFVEPSAPVEIEQFLIKVESKTDKDRGKLKYMRNMP